MYKKLLWLIHCVKRVIICNQLTASTIKANPKCSNFLQVHMLGPIC